MSDQSIERPDSEATDLDELNTDGVGATVTEGGESTFEPEEPEHPADDK